MPVLLTPSLVHQSFLQTIDAMEKHLDSFVLRPGRDFTRHRRLPLKDLVLLMMSMEKSTVEGEIHRFFSLRYPEHSILSRPSASAFIRQRAKLNDDFFPNLLKRFNTRFPFTKTKFGLHLLACDGTDNNIPADEDPDTFISYNSKDGGYYQFHSVALHDLLEKRYTDAVVQPRALMNENDACAAGLALRLFSVYGKCPSAVSGKITFQKTQKQRGENKPDGSDRQINREIVVTPRVYSEKFEQHEKGPPLPGIFLPGPSRTLYRKIGKMASIFHKQIL